MENLQTPIISEEEQKIVDLYDKGPIGDKLEYMKENGFEFNSLDYLRTKVKRIREKLGTNPKKQNHFEDTLEDNNFTPPENWSHGWLKTKGASVFIKNEQKIDWDKFQDTIVDKVKTYAPEYKKIEYTESQRDHCLIVDMADHHFGKLSSKHETGYNYNLAIAQNRFREGIEGILQKTIGFKKEKILFIVGNDILHIDNPKRTTTSGTPQDTDGMWHEAFTMAFNCYIEAIERLQTEAPIKVVYNPSNHDYMSGYMLVSCLQAFFNKNPNIEWDVDMRHRKYDSYGDNMVGFNHGDGAKEVNIGLLAATEAPEIWAKSKFRYIYMHHFHHKISKDQIGITIEYMRSASSPDRWHSDNGYVSKPAVDGIILHKTQGQIARITHYFDILNDNQK